MKKKSSRLLPVEKLAEDRANTAAADMTTARNSHQSHEQKLEELISYRLEYIEQFQSRGKTGMKANQLQQYQQFISQLDIAIQQQNTVVAQAGKKLDESQSHWRDKHSHKKALNKVVDKFKKKEFQVTEKIEQDDLDEHNTQRHNLRSRTE